ncbi:argininosuccinate lyase [soil metagenome]
MKLWEKGVQAEGWVTRFTVGNDPHWDTLLLPYDAEGTRVHAWALAQIGVLTAAEYEAISGALDRILDDVFADLLIVRTDDEDAHTVIERCLTEALGDTGKKIHAGRSRNDQVLVALRLWLRDALGEVAREAVATTEGLIGLAETTGGMLMPGYTHFQRAMPTTAGLWAAGYAELLIGDIEILAEARRRTNVSPWGSAAGYGVPILDLPRDAAAQKLGFDRVQTHVTAVQLSRGKLEASVVHALVQMGATANRLAADLVQFASAEFGFVSLPAAYTTGSSIMPQKRNPDVLELARATYHRLTAELQLLLSLPANLPSGYHRDLQLTKESVMRSVLTARDLFVAMRHVLPGIQFNEDAMRRALSPDLFATAEAMRRVKDGEAFRDAYREVGANLDSLLTPESEEALSAYTTQGGPGRVDIGGLRRRLADASGSEK